MDVLPADNAESAIEQLQKFAAVVRDHPDAARILENPTISADRRQGLVNEICRALQCIPPVRNLIDMLVERDRLNLLDEIIAGYQKLMDERLGIIRAHVRAALPLDSIQQRELETKLENVTGRKVRMEVALDPSLIGGVVAQVGTTIYDGSLRQQLLTIKNRLTEE
jgi:F-type H+-transporting ATPase subunit delta